MRGVLSLVVLGALLALVADPIIDVDPAQYADVASRLLRQRDWLHLSDMNGPFINKPPLAIWLEAAAMKVLGPTDVAARVPALLLVVVLVLATAWVGSALRDRAFGWRAALLLGCSVPCFVMVADPKVDLALTAMSTAAVGAFLRRGRWVVLGWVLTGLAVLSKGPIGLVLVASAVVPSKPARSWWHLLGAALGLAVVAPFYAAQSSGDRWYLLWSQGPGRLLSSAEFRDTTTPLFVVHTALWALLPMTPAVVVALWRRQGTRVATWWFLATLGVIALAAYKLPQYLFWASPAAALLAAEVELPKWCAAVLAGAAAVLGGVVLAVMFPVGVGASVAFAALLLAPAPLVRWGDRTVALAGSTLGFLVLFTVHVHGALTAYEPARTIADRLRREPPQDELPLVDVERTFALSFATQRTLRPVDLDELPPGLALVSVAALARSSRLDELERYERFHVSLPRWPFLNASTRQDAVETIVLVRAR